MQKDSQKSPELLSIATCQRRVTIDYTNWRGERGLRVILPEAIFFGSNEWHPEPQWLLRAYDVEKDLPRTFAMMSIHAWSDAPSNDTTPPSPA